MTEYDKQRIERLREKALSPLISFDEVQLDFLTRYENNSTLGSPEERYADAYVYALTRLQPSIDEDELIVGKPVHTLPESRKTEWESLRPFRESLSLPGQASHMAIDYELLLKEGTSGVARMIDAYAKRTDDPDKLAFYRLAKNCLSAVEICAENYARYAIALSENCVSPQRKAELLRIADICSRVPKYPATDFYEAVQSVHFVTYLLGFHPLLYYPHLYQLGHPDRYLLPYYEKDIREGKLDGEFARLLLDCLAVQLNRNTPSGLSVGYMVGGRDKNGSLVQNKLTELCMQVIDDVRLVYPAVGLCMTKDTDEKYLKKACEILSHGRSHPAIFNDEIISEGLRLYGVSEPESHAYIHSTCVEITPVTSSSCWVASPYVNTVEILLDVIAKKPAPASMQELLDEYFLLLDTQIENNYKSQLSDRKIRAKSCLCPLLSCFVNDCLARGKDIERGGARYRWIMPSFVGISNLIDSLYAIKRCVFERKELTLEKLNEILNKNFEGFESERLRLLNGIDKYGNDVADVDVFGQVVTQKIVELCKKHSKFYANEDRSDRLIPSVFCYVHHETFGRQTGATPDGRKAGFPLGDGSGPCQGREKKGPLASVLSSTSWSHKEMIGGVAVNMKLSPKTFTSASLNNVVAILKTYLERGGFEIQINIVDQETLLNAQRHPEAYADLLVRIGGYSDYFVRLSPQMQAEILLRTTHEV